ncbi:MAG: J domain-containing protein [Flavobacterium sp.]|nr:MAG: J domain-containing protein [Flavobacterium sp.]
MSVKTKNFVAGTGYYEVLEVSSVATTNEIQRSFERLCEEYVDIKDEDPQVRKSSAETLYILTKAYETLTDPFQRMNYDDRKYGSKQNNNNEVETIFREGMKASKASNNDTAIRFFKESVELFPHRPIYRVNLAIAYFEANNKEEAVKELRMALMLDPTNEFAQEVVAKLLFNVSDKKGIGFFINKANRQLVMAVAGMIVLVGTLYFGVPQIKKLLISIVL